MSTICDIETSTEEKRTKFRELKEKWDDFLAALDNTIRKGQDVFHDRDVIADPNLCFVLMPFDRKYRSLYTQVIKPAVRRAGLRCERADDIFNSVAIVQDVWVSVNRARIIVADMNYGAELERLNRCLNLPRLLMVEGRIAEIYWRRLIQVLPAKLEFSSRMHESHQMNASDPVNTLLNYGYAVLESECRKALFSVGLEPTVGFLHEARQAKYPLVYDLQEPYRWIVDTAVISSLEERRFSKKRDFYRTDNYVLRLRAEAARKLLDTLRVRFNSPVRFKGKLCSWDTVIRLKAQELANHILGKRPDLSFEEPSPALPSDDSGRARSLILSLSSADARKLRIGKSTLHYLRRRAKNNRSFQVYESVRRKLRVEGGA